MVWLDEEDMQDMCTNMRTGPPSRFSEENERKYTELLPKAIQRKLKGTTWVPPTYQTSEERARYAHWEESREKWIRDGNDPEKFLWVMSDFDQTLTPTTDHLSEMASQESINKEEERQSWRSKIICSLRTRQSSMCEDEFAASKILLSAMKLSEKLQEIASPETLSSFLDQDQHQDEQAVHVHDANAHISKKRKIREDKDDSLSNQVSTTLKSTDEFIQSHFRN